MQGLSEFLTNLVRKKQQSLLLRNSSLFNNLSPPRCFAKEGWLNVVPKSGVFPKKARSPARDSSGLPEHGLRARLNTAAGLDGHWKSNQTRQSRNTGLEGRAGSRVPVWESREGNRGGVVQAGGRDREHKVQVLVWQKTQADEWI